MDEMRDAVRGTLDQTFQQRVFEKNSLTYDLGRSEEDLEVTQRYERELQRRSKDV